MTPPIPQSDAEGWECAASHTCINIMIPSISGLKTLTPLQMTVQYHLGSESLCVLAIVLKYTLKVIKAAVGLT